MKKRVKKISSRRKRQELIWGWLFILPTALGLLVLNIIPIFQTIYQSFFKTGAFGKGNIFVGADNYVKLFHDPVVWQSLFNTVKYALIEVPFSIIIALVIAVFLNRKMRGRTLYRVIYFLPMVAAPAAIAMVWKWLYNADYGLINKLLELLNIPMVNWLSDPDIAIISLAVVGIWSVVGYNMILFLAGLQEIPRDYYEAAAIDGATGIHQFFHITLPLISPTMFFVTVTKIIGAFQVFDSIFLMMDKSNPAFYKTQSLIYLFYRYSFIESNKGYGSTIVVLLLVLIMLITVIQLKCQKKWVNYD